jgi:Domain of unknown function (DUF1707)
MVHGPGDAMGARARAYGRMRAADTDREQAIEAVKAAFVQGRLAKDELDIRAGQVFAARTYAELAAVTADLPAEPARPPRARPLPGPARPSARKVLISCVLTIIVTELFLVLAVFAFPIYGTLDLAVLANLVGLPLAGGLMLDTWRATHSRRPMPPRAAPGPPRPGQRGRAPGGERGGPIDRGPSLCASHGQPGGRGRLRLVSVPR